MSKFQLPNTRLYLADGTAFSIGAPTTAQDSDTHEGKREGEREREGVQRQKLSKRQRSRIKRKAASGSSERGGAVPRLFYVSTGWAHGTQWDTCRSYDKVCIPIVILCIKKKPPPRTDG